MEKEALLREIIDNHSLIKGVFSNLRKKSLDSFKKVDVKPVLIREEIMYQFTYYYSEKVIHKNLEHDKAGLEMLDLKWYFQAGYLVYKGGRLPNPNQ